MVSLLKGRSDHSSDRRRDRHTRRPGCYRDVAEWTDAFPSRLPHRSQKVILVMLPSVPTSHPTDRLANATAQKLWAPWIRVHVSPSSLVYAAPSGPVATTRLRSGAWSCAAV